MQLRISGECTQELPMVMADEGSFQGSFLHHVSSFGLHWHILTTAKTARLDK